MSSSLWWSLLVGCVLGFCGLTYPYVWSNTLKVWRWEYENAWPFAVLAVTTAAVVGLTWITTYSWTVDRNKALIIVDNPEIVADNQRLVTAVERLDREVERMRGERNDAIFEGKKWKDAADGKESLAASLQSDVTALKSERDVLRQQLDDRQQTREKRAQFAVWSRRLGELNSRAINEGIGDEEWESIKQEFVAFAAEHCTQDELALLDSGVGISTPTFLPKSIRDIKDASEKSRRTKIWGAIYRWNVRVNEFIQSSSRAD